jgi:hypothetical protein
MSASLSDLEKKRDYGSDSDSTDAGASDDSTDAGAPDDCDRLSADGSQFDRTPAKQDCRVVLVSGCDTTVTAKKFNTFSVNIDGIGVHSGVTKVVTSGENVITLWQGQVKMSTPFRMATIIVPRTTKVYISGVATLSWVDKDGIQHRPKVTLEDMNPHSVIAAPPSMRRKVSEAHAVLKTFLEEDKLLTFDSETRRAFIMSWYGQFREMARYTLSGHRGFRQKALYSLKIKSIEVCEALDAKDEEKKKLQAMAEARRAEIAALAASSKTLPGRHPRRLSQ